MSTASGQRNRGARRQRLRLTPRFWLIVALATFVYIAASYASGFLEVWRLRMEIRQVRAEIADTEARNQELRNELEYLQSDEYIEKVAREELGLVKPGETPVLFTSPNESPGTPPDRQSSQAPEAGRTGP